MEEDGNGERLTQNQKWEKIREEFENSDENPVTLLPGAKSTLTHLQKRKIPFALLTNTQYDAHDEAVNKLRCILGVPLASRQLIQRPTPFTHLVLKFRRKPVLAIGRDSNSCSCKPVRDFAEGLGFEDVYTSSDYYEVYSNLALAAYTPPNHVSDQAIKLHKGLHHSGPHVEISAILVFGHVSPNDKEVESYDMPNKLLVPILKSQTSDLRIESRFNGKTCLPNIGYQQAWAPKVYYDTGAYQYEEHHRSLEKAWRDETGRKLLGQVEIARKSTLSMFAYAETRLSEIQKEMYGDGKGIETIVMIGDTPECDIEGVNLYTSNAGVQWKRVLVETGVWPQDEDGVLEAVEVPGITVKGIREAVGWGGVGLGESEG